MAENHDCSLEKYFCFRHATKFEEEKWWCWQHAPMRQKMDKLEQSRRADLYPEMLAAIMLCKLALSPPGSFEYAADRSSAIGDAYNSLQTIIRKCEGKK